MSQTGPQGQQLGVPLLQEESPADHAVRREDQPEDKAPPGGDPPGQLRQGRLDCAEGQGGQNAPDQGELGADPAFDMSGDAAVVPEADGEGPVVEEVDQIFRRRGHRAPTSAR